MNDYDGDQGDTSNNRQRYSNNCAITRARLLVVVVCPPLVIIVIIIVAIVVSVIISIVPVVVPIIIVISTIVVATVINISVSTILWVRLIIISEALAGNVVELVPMHARASCAVSWHEMTARIALANACLLIIDAAGRFLTAVSSFVDTVRVLIVYTLITFLDIRLLTHTCV